MSAAGSYCLRSSLEITDNRPRQGGADCKTVPQGRSSSGAGGSGSGGTPDTDKQTNASSLIANVYLVW